MLQKFVIAAVAAVLLAGLLPSKAEAWGAVHRGYTHVGPNGVYHVGHTAGVGPYGGFSTGHVGAYGAYGGAYHAGYGGAARYGYGDYRYGYGGYHYAPSYYGGAYGVARPYGFRW